MVYSAEYAAPSEKEVALINSRRNWWSFQKPRRAEPPASTSNWVKTPIDAFLLDAMKKKGLAPNPRASRETLIRRVTLDLTGLPPSPGEVDLFLADTAPDAYEKLVDRLMKSSHYGERWGQRWLDVVRYADTNGFELDSEREHAWRYRDYVVRAFNEGKPFDRFIREQIAGDEIWPGNAEALIATGFHRAGPRHIVGGNQDDEMNRQEVLTDMTTSIGSVFLGLTMHCARCHNHKFDPILQSDYYRLQAILAATEEKEIPLASAEEKARYEAAKKAHEARNAALKKQVTELEKPYRDRLTAERRKTVDPKLLALLDIPEKDRTPEQKRLAKEAKDQITPAWDEVVEAMDTEPRRRRNVLRAQMHAYDLNKPEEPAAAFAVVNLDKAPPTHILKVGDHKMKLGEVGPGLPLVLTAPGQQVSEGPAGRRTALANWLASPEHPLVARVMVNRIWQFRMGTGLVTTANDFGALGQRPTNPALLDWLATEFVAGGWSVRALDRMILLSNAYQQSTESRPAQAKLDPENKFYWRMNKRRLEGEAIRDGILAVTGKLNQAMGGRPVKAPLEQEVYELIFTEHDADNLWPVDPDERTYNRRSLYLLNKRTVRMPFLANFDQPDTMSSCPVRSVSTHALQALSLMNSEFANEQAQAFAARLRRECGNDPGCHLRRAYKLALGRPPRPAETAMARGFHAKGGHLEDFCLALINRNEFVYVP